MMMIRPNAAPQKTKVVTQRKCVSRYTHTHTHWKIQKESFYKLKRHLTLQTHYIHRGKVLNKEKKKQQTYRQE